MSRRELYQTTETPTRCTPKLLLGTCTQETAPQREGRPQHRAPAGHGRSQAGNELDYFHRGNGKQESTHTHTRSHTRTPTRNAGPARLIQIGGRGLCQPRARLSALSNFLPTSSPTTGGWTRGTQPSCAGPSTQRFSDTPEDPQSQAQAPGASFWRSHRDSESPEQQQTTASAQDKLLGQVAGAPAAPECRPWQRGTCGTPYLTGSPSPRLQQLHTRARWHQGHRECGHIYMTAPTRKQGMTKSGERSLPARGTGKASWKRQPLSWVLAAGRNLNVESVQREEIPGSHALRRGCGGEDSV